MRRQAYQGTTAYDYNAHISTLERTPSVLGDVPRYPNLYPLFGRKTAAHYEVEKHPRFKETVEVIEFREEKPDDHGRKEEEHELVEEAVCEFLMKLDRYTKRLLDEACRGPGFFRFSPALIRPNCNRVDFKAGDFIEQKHKSFELCKWKTFKVL